MKLNFGVIVPPTRKTITVNATEQENGTELEIQFRAMDIPTAQEAALFGYDMIRKYVPHSKRKMLQPEKGEQEPEPFPAGPTTGYIELNEQACLEAANLVFCQSAEEENERYTFVDFIWMRSTCPTLYRECQKAILSLIGSDEDLEGNLPAGGGLA